MRVSLLITLLALCATFVACQADETPHKSRRGPSSYSRRRELDSGGEVADLEGNRDQGPSSRRGQLSAVPRPTKQTGSDHADTRTERSRRRFGNAAAAQQRGSNAEDSSGPRIEASTRRHQEQPVPSERTVIRTVKRRPAPREHQTKPVEHNIEDDDNYPEHFKQQLKSGKSPPVVSNKEPRPQSVRPTEKEASRPRTSPGISRRLPRPQTTSAPDPVELQAPEPKTNVLTKPRVSPGFARGRLTSRAKPTSSETPPNIEDAVPEPKLSPGFARGRLPSRTSPTIESSEALPSVEVEKTKLSSGFVRARLQSRPSATSSKTPANIEDGKQKSSPGFARGRLPSRPSPTSVSSEAPLNEEDKKPKSSQVFARGRLPSRPSPTSAPESQGLNEASLTREPSRSQTTSAREENGSKPRVSSGFARGRSLSHRSQATSAPEPVSSKLSPSSLRSRTSLFRDTAKLRTTLNPKVEPTTETAETNVEVPAEADDDKDNTEEQTTESSTRGTSSRGRQSSRSRSTLDEISSETKDSSSTPTPEVNQSTPEGEEESVSEESVQSTPRAREYVRRKNVINYSSAEQTTEATTSTSTARTREYVRRKYNINYSSTESIVQSSTESAVNTPRTRQYVRRKNNINYSSEEQTTAVEPGRSHRSREFTRGRHTARSKKEQVSEVSTTTESNLPSQADPPVENISEELTVTEVAMPSETTLSNSPRSRYSAKHRRLQVPRDGKNVNITAIKSKHRYSSKFRSNLFLAKATSTPSPNDVAQTTEMSEQEAIRRLREKFPLLSSRVPNKRPRWFTSTTPISDLVAAPASESPSLLTSTDPIEPNDFTEVNFAQETMAEPIVDAAYTTVPPVEISTSENKPTMISFVLHTHATPAVDTAKEWTNPESEAATINSATIENLLVTTTESTNELIDNFVNEIHTEKPRIQEEVEQMSQYVTEINSNQVPEPTTTTEHISTSTSRFILKNGILLLNTEPTSMKTDKKPNNNDQSLDDVLLNQIVPIVSKSANEITTSNPSVTLNSTLLGTLSNTIYSPFSTTTYKPVAYSSTSTSNTTYAVPTTYTPTSISTTKQVPITHSFTSTSTTTHRPITSASTSTSTTTQLPITHSSISTSTSTQIPIKSTNITTQVPITSESTSTSTTTQAPITSTSTFRSTMTQEPKAYFTTTTVQVPLMYQPRFAMRIPIAPPGTMSSTPSSAIRYHFILKTTPETSTNFQNNPINSVTANKTTSIGKPSEETNMTLLNLNTSSTSVTSSTTLPTTIKFLNNKEFEVSRSNINNLNSISVEKIETNLLKSTVASIRDTSSTIVSLPSVTSQTTRVPSTTKDLISNAITNPTTRRIITTVATTPRITVPITLTTLLITKPVSTTPIPVTTSVSPTPIPVTTPVSSTVRVTTISVTTPRGVAVTTTPTTVTKPLVHTPSSTTLPVTTISPLTTPRETATPTKHTPITTRATTPVRTTPLVTTPATVTTISPLTTPRVTATPTKHTPITTRATTPVRTTPLVTTPATVTTISPLTTPRETATPTKHTPITTRATTPVRTTPLVTTPATVTTTLRATTPALTTHRATTPTTVTTPRATTTVRATPRVTTPSSTTHENTNDITLSKEYDAKPTDWTYRNLQNIDNPAPSSNMSITTEKNSAASKNVPLKVESPNEDVVGLTSQDLLILELLSRQRLGHNVLTTVQPNNGLQLNNVLESQRGTQGTQNFVAQQKAPSYTLPVNPEPADATWFTLLRQLGSASFGLPAPQHLPVRTEALPRATTTTTTLAPRTNLQESQRNPKRQRIQPEITTEAPESINLRPVPQDDAGNTQSALVTVAINVTRTVAGLMGRVIQGAARTVSAVVSDSGRVFANYLQTWQIPVAQ